MKKIALLLSGLLAAGAASAQLGSVTLSGTSYTENFDGLATGLPTGWHVFTAATTSSLGYLRDTSVKLILTPGTTTRWSNTTGAFKNVASGNNSATYSPFAQDTTGQLNATDRALAVRQVSGTSTSFPTSDSGAAFAVKLANTSGLSNFFVSFKLQSLDSTSGRVTTWTLDYGFGDNPTSFTTYATAGTTGGNVYANNNVGINFGSDLDNQTGPVWIRVVTLSGSQGAGNRTTSAIDDFNLTYDAATVTCNVPTNLTASNITSQSAQIDWNGVVGASQYDYVLDQSSSDPSVTGAAQTSTSKAESGLTPSTMYYYHVRTDCGSGNFSAWVTNSFMTLDPAGIANVSNNATALSVLGYPTTNSMTLAFTLKQAGSTAVTITDLAGRTVYNTNIAATTGTQQQSLSGLNLVPGMYLVRISNGKETGIIKTTVR